jgi:hypothetical protein
MEDIERMELDVLPSPATPHGIRARVVAKPCTMLLISLLCIQHAFADALSGRALERKLAGHTWTWKSKKFESSGITTYFRDGRTTTRIDGQDDRPQWGRWRIDGDKVCMNFVGNRESCSGSIEEIDDRTLFASSSETTFTLQEP